MLLFIFIASCIIVCILQLMKIELEKTREQLNNPNADNINLLRWKEFFLNELVEDL